MNTTSSLRSVPLFSQLREEDLERVARAATARRYPKDTMIVLESDAGDALYVVLEGQVKLVLSAEDGREIILATRSKGDFFGEMSLIDDQPTPFNAIAMGDAELLVLRRDDFRRCLSEIPGMSLGLLRALCERLRKADSQIGGLVFLDVKGRVARLILELSDRHESDRIPRAFTHNVIAQMIGSTRETVSRTIRELADDGAIEASRTRVAVKDRAMLEAAARYDVLPMIEKKAEPALAAAGGDSWNRRATD
jgi:CRP/FNR family cyclic AMP-dependent transcriptional regulator